MTKTSVACELYDFYTVYSFPKRSNNVKCRHPSAFGHTGIINTMLRLILVMCACMFCCFSHARLFATLWAVACQAPLSLGFSRQEYWRGCHALLQGELPDPGIKPMSPASPALTGGFFTTEPPGKPDSNDDLTNRRKMPCCDLWN